MKFFQVFFYRRDRPDVAGHIRRAVNPL